MGDMGNFWKLWETVATGLQESAQSAGKAVLSSLLFRRRRDIRRGGRLSQTIPMIQRTIPEKTYPPMTSGRLNGQVSTARITSRISFTR